jgi:predicted alpha/beta-hydrolase family hydrolase
MAAKPELLFDGPVQAPWTVAIAHGAGAGINAPFMDFFGKGLAKHGYRVVRFEYPFTAAKRATGKRKPPDCEPERGQRVSAVRADVGVADLLATGPAGRGLLESTPAGNAGGLGPAPVTSSCRPAEL